jgi:hypothetical protein
MIKYTFHNPCQKKCKQVINRAVTYQILKYYLKFNDQYGHFFEFMSMILKNHMFKIYLNRSLKNASIYILLSRLPKKTK